jgi:hypothetical protein
VSAGFIPAGNARPDGDLILPPSATGVVLFAHGSSRFNPRNIYIAEALHL